MNTSLIFAFVNVIGSKMFCREKVPLQSTCIFENHKGCSHGATVHQPHLSESGPGWNKQRICITGQAFAHNTNSLE